MTINQVSNPSFGRIYQAASSNAAREALSKYIKVIKDQKSALSKIEEHDYDVFVNMRDQSLPTDFKAKNILTVEIRKKLMEPFKDENTEILALENGDTGVKTFVEGSDIRRGIQQFFAQVKKSLS